MKRLVSNVLAFLLFSGAASSLFLTFTIQCDGSEVEAMAVEKAKLNGVEIAFGIHGKSNGGTPILLVMGYGCTMDMWPTRMIQVLSTSHRVIVFDSRGMGYSTAGDEAFSMELFAEDAFELLKALGVEGAHVLGWSMGTGVAMELALRHPEAVRKLVLVSGFCGGRESVPATEETWAKLTDLSGTIEERVQRMFSSIFPGEWLAENPDPMKVFPQITEPVNDEGIQRQALAIAQWQGVCPRLPNLAADMLLITGTDDVVVPPENSFIIAREVSGSSVVQIRGGGHGVMYQYPERTMDFIMAFLR